jgi:hypothetical protein
MSATAYPLQWPEGWPRTPYHQRQNDYRFRSSGCAFSGRGELTVARTLKELRRELRLLGAWNVIVSTLKDGRQLAPRNHASVGDRKSS